MSWVTFLPTHYDPYVPDEIGVISVIDVIDKIQFCKCPLFYIFFSFWLPSHPSHQLQKLHQFSASKRKRIAEKILYIRKRTHLQN